MSLEKRFLELELDLSECPYNSMSENTAKQCVEICDEFSVGFAEFSINYNYHPSHKVWIRMDKMANEKYTTTELLEIYKQEL